jgi:hypothetical protein
MDTFTPDALDTGVSAPSRMPEPPFRLLALALGLLLTATLVGFVTSFLVGFLEHGSS